TLAAFTYSYDFNNDGTFDVVNSPSASVSSTFSEEGSYTVRGRIMDKDGDYSEYTSVVTVSDPAVVPTGGFTFSAVEGAPSASQKVATFTDPGGAEALADYSATINWGDGGATSAGTITVSGSVFTV